MRPVREVRLGAWPDDPESARTERAERPDNSVGPCRTHGLHLPTRRERDVRGGGVSEEVWNGEGVMQWVWGFAAFLTLMVGVNIILWLSDRIDSRLALNALLVVVIVTAGGDVYCLCQMAAAP